MKRENKKNRGFLAVEIIVAVSIILVSMWAAIAVTEKALTLSRQALHSTEAAFLLEEGAEAVRVARDNAWTNISSLSSATNYYPTFTAGSWTLSSTPSAVGIFTRTVTIASVNRDNTTADIAVSGTDDPKTKLVTVSVTWLEGSTTVTKNLQFYILDIFS